MKYTFKQLMRKARQTGLTPATKTAGRARLQTLMAEHPALDSQAIIRSVRNSETLRQLPQRSRFSSLFLFNLKNHMPIIIILALLLGGSATTYAAEGALPGTMLYPLKVHFIEPVEMGLTLSTKAKAELNLELAAERLREAKVLAAHGELNATTTAELKENFHEHLTEAEHDADELSVKHDNESAAKVSALIQAVLRANASTSPRILPIILPIHPYGQEPGEQSDHESDNENRGRTQQDTQGDNHGQKSTSTLNLNVSSTTRINKEDNDVNNDVNLDSSDQVQVKTDGRVRLRL